MNNLNSPTNPTHILYECGICGGLHLWNFNGDCRDNANRYADIDDYTERNAVDWFDTEVRSWQERMEADERSVQ